jgi:hypothetical protein
MKLWTWIFQSVHYEYSDARVFEIVWRMGGCGQVSLLTRVSSKQSNFVFGSNQNSICIGCLSVCFAKPKNVFFGLFRCFGPVSKHPKQTEFCQNKPKQTENISKKRSLLGGSSKPLIFFLGSNQNKPKFELFRLFFGLLFRETQFFFFGLFRCFGLGSKQPKQTELIVWGSKKVDILTNLLLFRLVFCLFQLFWNTETPCLGIKAKQPKQISCLG